MPDLNVLRQRVEDAERRLAAAQKSRENECQGLMDMWLQIRDRFQAQEQEIAAYRARLSVLQDANVQLTELVGCMLRGIEGNVTQAEEDAIPAIMEMARNLLHTEPGSQETETNFRYEDLRNGTAEPSLGGIVDSENLNLEPVTEPASVPASREAPTPTRDLPERMRRPSADALEEEREETAESAGGPSDVAFAELAAQFTNPEDFALPEDHEDIELGRELEEIELLRRELSGLRQRITTASAAE